MDVHTYRVSRFNYSAGGGMNFELYGYTAGLLILLFVVIGLYIAVKYWIKPSKVYKRMIAFIWRKPYLYTLTEEYTCPYPVDSEDVEHEWVTIKDGVMTVKAGYTWNGCSPKRNLLDLRISGTPEGIIDYRTGLPKTYHASLCHDARYQYQSGTKENADTIFLSMMEDMGFAPARAYYWAVAKFGVKW